MVNYKTEVIETIFIVDQYNELIGTADLRYDLKAIPVINKRRVILRIITVDDIIDVIVEEQTEDL